MKTVFPNFDAIAHIFANKTQDVARTANGFVENEAIYSYGRHFMIAKHVTNESGQRAVLFTTRGYSVTTSKHISVTKYACNHLNLIYCPYPEHTIAHSYNFENWIGEIESISRNLDKAKKPEKYISQIEAIAKRVNIYCDFFGCENDIPEKLKALMSITKKEEFAAYQIKKQVLELAQEAKRLKEQTIKHKKQLKEFYAGKLRTLNIRNGLDYLRINKTSERIETTQGVEIPLKTAQKFYGWIMSRKKDCIDCGKKILDFEVKELTKKHLTVGCHKIEIKEINKIAKKLSWN